MTAIDNGFGTFYRNFVVERFFRFGHGERFYFRHIGFIHDDCRIKMNFIESIIPFEFSTKAYCRYNSYSHWNSWNTHNSLFWMKLWVSWKDTLFIRNFISDLKSGWNGVLFFPKFQGSWKLKYSSIFLNHLHWNYCPKSPSPNYHLPSWRVHLSMYSSWKLHNFKCKSS